MLLDEFAKLQKKDVFYILLQYCTSIRLPNCGYSKDGIRKGSVCLWNVI